MPVLISRFPSFLWRFLDNGYYLSQNIMGRYPLVVVNGKDTLNEEEEKQHSKQAEGTLSTP